MFTKRSFSLAILFIALLAACAPGAGIPTATPTSDSLPVPGLAMEYVLQSNMLDNGCSTDGLGSESPNTRVLELREDGEDYLLATGRKDGWQIRFDCTDNPRLIVNVVVTYNTLAGPIQALSREWHVEVWDRIDTGELEQLPDMPGLGEHQIVFRDANGTIGVEFTYRNVYFFLTGTADEGVDNYDFFAELAAAQLARTASMVP